MAECNMPDLTLDQTGETSFSGMSEFCVEKVEEVSTKKKVGVCTLTEMVEKKEKDEKEKNRKNAEAEKRKRENAEKEMKAKVEGVKRKREAIDMVDGEYRFFQSLANKALVVLNA